MTQLIEGEVVPGSEELVIREAAPPTLFGTDDPRLIIAKASGVADALKDVIVKQKMALRIGQSEYIKVEGWTTLGALLGVFPKVEWTREVWGPVAPNLSPDEKVSLGWEAAVVVVNGAGVEIGRAEAQCLRSERNWKGRDDFALRSMAQTRAMGKALRMPLGWIAVMAGYEATPAEEMPVPAVADDDVPFDSTGPQGLADGMKAEGNTTGTGASLPTTDEHPDLTKAVTRAEANENRRVELTGRLLELSELLGKRVVTESAIAKDRLKNEAKPASHLTWLEKQVTSAEAAVDAQQEIPL